MKIFLSVGHSILKNGNCTSSDGYVNEYRYNKALAPYVKSALERKGHSVDVIIVPERKGKSQSYEPSYKLPIANSGKYDLVCELHLNASNGKGHGMECFYYGNDKRGKKIADRMCTQFSSLGFRNRGAKSSTGLYILRETKPLAVLVESFFCDNKNDCDLADKLGYGKIAEAIAVGLVGGSMSNTSPTSQSKPAKPFKGYYVLTSTPNDVLNVREKPNATSRIVSSYRDGSKIYVHEVIHTSDSTWYKIEYHKGKFGYVAARYCKGIK